MTLVLCEKHGSTPVANVCSHLFESLSTDPGSIALVRIELTYKGENFSPSHVCADCLSTLAVNPAVPYELGTDDAERVFKAATSGWCSSCLSERAVNIE